MEQYASELKVAAREHHAEPDYSLATGSAAFAVPVSDQTETEQAYVRMVGGEFAGDTVAAAAATAATGSAAKQ